MKNIAEQIIEYLLANPPNNEADILATKREFCKKLEVKEIPENSELLKELRLLLSKNSEYSRGPATPLAKARFAQDDKLLKLLRKRQVRTLSGVAPIAVLTKAYECKGKCAYCPNEKAMPKSYLSNEPAVMRAILCKFDPYEQVALRLRALDNNGHSVDKLELIVMGGTWHHLPEKYRLWYITECFRAANNFKLGASFNFQDTTRLPCYARRCGQVSKKISISKFQISNLYKEQKINEKAQARIIGLTLETRPDCIDEKELLKMRELGCTRIEIGVQHTDDQILKLNRRGHTRQQTIEATKLMRNFGFKITYHLMLNLPGSTPGKDLAMAKEVFTSPDFQPDQVKLYPCVVTKYSLLYKWWQQGKYKAYSKKQLVDLLIKIKSIVPEWVRIIRVIRDIPEESIVAGNKITNLRQEIKDRVECRCIRCREVGHQGMGETRNKKQKTKKHKNANAEFVETRFIASNSQGQIKFVIRKYKAADGTEYFLSFESEDEKILYAFCRLKMPNKSTIKNLPTGQAGLKSEIINSPIIRELHTYGQMIEIGKTGETQHRGLGKKLMRAAETIVKQHNFKKLYVISGIGVRDYYRKLGYRLRGTYMVKYL